MREPLLTDRLILRDITEADAEAMFDLDSDPEVMRFIGPRPGPARSTVPSWKTKPLGSDRTGLKVLPVSPGGIECF